MAMRVSFRERNLTLIAITAVLGTILAIVATFRIAELPILAGATHSADFAETGGLEEGDPVQVSGVVVGKVTGMSLEGNAVRVRFTVKNLDLGSETRASIKTGSLLGARYVDVQPAGSGELEDTIPLSRTSAPYDLSSELIGIAGHTRKIDLDTVSKALRTFSRAIEPSTEEIGPAMEAVTDLSEVVTTRDAAVRELFRRAENVTGTLRQRTRQITRLMVDGQRLLQELLLRRTVITNLLANARAVADEVSSLVRDNRKDLAPALEELEDVLDLLVRNKDNIRVAVNRISDFITPLGEGVASGPWFFGYVDLAPGVASLHSQVGIEPRDGAQDGGRR